MLAEKETGQSKEFPMPTINRASDVLNPERRMELGKQLEQLQRERIQGENEVLDHPLF